MEGDFRMNKVQGCRFCFPSEKEHILKETHNFYVIPSIGSIVEGYLLLNIKYHIPSFEEMPEHFLDEFLTLKDEIKDGLEYTYGRGCIFYEHGRAGVSITLQGKDKISYHAHLHCVATSVDLLEMICKDYKPIKINEWREVKRLAKNYPHYLYYENKKNKYFFPVDIYVRRQYLRSCLAKTLHIPNAADWMAEPKWENVENTVKKLSLYFSKKW